MSKKPTTDEIELDPIAVLKAADEISQLEQEIKKRKAAIKSATNKVLKDRRAKIIKVLGLKEITGSDYYDGAAKKKNERRYIIDQIAKAHAQGRVTIPSLDTTKETGAI